MNVVTRQIMAAAAVKRAREWKAKEFPWVVALRTLRDEDVTPGAVDAAVGHGAQTRLTCNECGRDDADALVTIGEEPDYESATASACLPCLRKAVALAEATP